MNKNFEKNMYKHKNKSIHCYYASYPAGGYIAWPDGTSSSFQKDSDNKNEVHRYINRKGYVAWPNEKQAFC